MKARKLLLYSGSRTSSPHVSRYLSGSKVVEPSVCGLFGIGGMACIWCAKRRLLSKID